MAEGQGQVEVARLVARADGLLPADPAATVEGPQALAAVSLVQVVDPHLDAIEAMAVFIRPGLGVVPIPRDPGFDASET